MATKYSADLGPPIDKATITEAAAAEGSKDVEVLFAVGVTRDDQILALEQLADHISSFGGQSAVAAP